MKTCEGDVVKVKQKIGKITEKWLEKWNVNYDELIFGKPYADLYIDDLAKAVKWVVGSEVKYKNYNICTGKSFSYLSLAEKIQEISGKKLEIIIENDTGEYEYSGDSSRFCSESGIKFTNIDKALEKIYSWCEKNKDIINKKHFVY